MIFGDATGTVFLANNGLKNGCTNGVCENAEDSSMQLETIFLSLHSAFSADDSLEAIFLFSCTAKDTGARVYKITYKICSRLGERYFIRNAAFRHLKELVTFSHLAVCDLVQLALPPSFGRKSYWARFSAYGHKARDIVN